ncbi:phosphorothioated DNA-binding restriction endonuclease [Salimicrobium halophilum]|uniref:Putative restriction endonuclease n=1 Tax=Salimicrobium halophilum TaxID=86666 RepID=A0A1G8QWU7_9BACI|nr:HNH endonuclease [Salimicrobium halophilum]SDJ09204.1 putative restriction endonuclease [Salimicrobium halophilum]
MNKGNLINQLDKIKTDKGGRNNSRSPNKPLLLLYALGQFLRGNKQLWYKETAKNLVSLLDEYGPSIKGEQNTWDPFVRLKNDGIWYVTPDIETAGARVRKRDLVNTNILGGFTDEVIQLFQMDKSVVSEAASILLNNHFPETLHDEILKRTGFDIGVRTYKKRNPAFRRKIMEAYDERCAVCGFQAKMNEAIVAVEAAHIKWHEAHGPDTEENGMALCSLHHKLFDKGIFTVTPGYEIVVSDRATGRGPFKALVTDFHGKDIMKPASTIYLPSPEFTEWHVKEVFKSYQ